MRDTTLISLSKHLNDVFVETGTAEGAGVAMAMRAGFKKIFSIEINPELQARNVEKYRGISGIELITGDSAVELPGLISRITVPATFWLDAHFECRGPVGVSVCPLYWELEAIRQSPIKTHTVMIDDMRVIGRKHWGRVVIKDELIRLLKLINPAYRISFEDNSLAAGDIMVACV